MQLTFEFGYIFCFILNAVTVVAYRGKVVMEKKGAVCVIFFLKFGSRLSAAYT